MMSYDFNQKKRNCYLMELFCNLPSHIWIPPAVTAASYGILETETCNDEKNGTKVELRTP